MVRRLEITIERRSVTIIRTTGIPNHATCEECGQPVTAFSAMQIAGILGVAVDEVCRRVDGHELHLVSRTNEVALICSASLGGETRLLPGQTE